MASKKGMGTGSKVALGGILFATASLFVFAANNQGNNKAAYEAQQQAIQAKASAAKAKQAKADKEALDKMLAAQKAAYTPWYVKSFKEELTGKTVWNAIGDHVMAYGNLSFPYEHVQSHITLGKQDGKLFALFNFSITPNILNVSSRSMGQDHYKITASFDGKQDTITVFQNWNSKNVYVMYPVWFTNKLKHTKELKIKMAWAGQGAMYYKYDVSKASQALVKFK